MPTAPIGSSRWTSSRHATAGSFSRGDSKGLRASLERTGVYFRSWPNAEFPRAAFGCVTGRTGIPRRFTNISPNTALQRTRLRARLSFETFGAVALTRPARLCRLIVDTEAP